VRRIVLLLLVLPCLLLAGCGSGDDEAASGGETTTTTITTEISECADVQAPEARAAETREAPSEPLDSSKTYALTFDTTCGSFTVTLDQKLAPNTAASLVALAKDGYFDDTIFHRVVPGFVIQGGDPTQTGSGGPGYSTVDPAPSDAKYPKGTVAMAKSEFEAPGTSGSQFFVVSGDASFLTPDYAIVGEVTDGMDTVARIDALGVQGGTGAPSQPVVISGVTVTES
jgi:peptidyl-prolyl cis-trans isomerase B (cyclophilin B)